MTPLYTKKVSPNKPIFRSFYRRVSYLIVTVKLQISQANMNSLRQKWSFYN